MGKLSCKEAVSKVLIDVGLSHAALEASGSKGDDFQLDVACRMLRPSFCNVVCSMLESDKEKLLIKERGLFTQMRYKRRVDDILCGLIVWRSPFVPLWLVEPVMKTLKNKRVASYKVHF